MVCEYRPLKSENHRVQFAVGGDKLDYLYDATSLIVSLIETMILLNSVISNSDKGAHFFTLDTQMISFYKQI